MEAKFCTLPQKRTIIFSLDPRIYHQGISTISLPSLGKLVEILLAGLLTLGFIYTSSNPGGSSESSSSIRFSSSSAPRSLTDIPIQSDTQSPHSRNLHDIPLPPISGALRAAAGRTFSFGGRFSKASPSNSLARQSTPGPSKNRTMTSSTASIATPPKLLDDLNVGQLGEEFKSMFDDLGKRDSAHISESTSLGKPLDMVRVTPFALSSSAFSNRVNVNNLW